MLHKIVKTHTISASLLWKHHCVRNFNPQILPLLAQTQGINSLWTLQQFKRKLTCIDKLIRQQKVTNDVVYRRNFPRFVHSGNTMLKCCLDTAHEHDHFLSVSVNPNKKSSTRPQLCSPLAQWILGYFRFCFLPDSDVVKCARIPHFSQRGLIVHNVCVHVSSFLHTSSVWDLWVWLRSEKSSN